MPIFDPKRDVNTLPYREIGECYLLYKGKLVAQDHGHYLSLPGGGIDEGESPEIGDERELMEELGAKLKGRLQLISTMTWDWNHEWANTEKRKKRYMAFRGERVYSLFGIVEEFVDPTSDEGDGWKGEKLMLLGDASELQKKFLENSALTNQYAYLLTKLNIISTMNQLKKNLSFLS